MSFENLAKECNGRLLLKRQEMKSLLDKVDPASGKPAWDKADHEKFTSLDTEVKDLAKESRDYQEKAKAQAENDAEMASLTEPSLSNGFGSAAAHSAAGFEPKSFSKSLGQLVTGSKECKSRANFSQPFTVDLKEFDANFKTTMTTAAGFAPANNRLNDVVPYAVRKVNIFDVVPQITVGDIGVVKYMEETTHTASNASAAENSALAESAYAYTERSVTIESIGAILPLTEQQMEDVPFLTGLLDQLMTDDQMRAEETQILSGNGSTPQLNGFLNKSGVQTQAKSTDSAEVACYKAMTLVRYTGYAEPTAFVLNPTDWQNIRIHQDANGRFIWGDPWLSGPEMFWGVPVIQNPAETAGTALVGAFKPYSYVARRKGVKVEIGYNSTDFAYLKRTARVWSRLALVIRRPTAFCKVTGL